MGLGKTTTLLCLLLALFAASPQKISAQELKDQSQLVVFVAVKDGHLVADRNKSLFNPSPVFTQRAKITQAEARTMLLDDLDQAFAALAGLYWYALSDDEKASDAQGTLSDAATNGVRHFTGSWSSFADLFNAWASGGSNRFPLPMVFSGVGVLQDVTNFDERTPLIFGDDDTAEFDSGQITFRVADPIGDLNNAQDYQIAFADSASGAHLVARQADIVNLLRPLVGKLWRAADIRARLEDFYVARGLQPSITLSRAGENPKQIIIRESLRIARIILPQSADNEIDKILYLLLSDKEFRIFLHHRAAIMKDTLDVPGQAGLRAVDYGKHLGRAPGTEPYVNLLRLQIEQQQLALIGFTIAQVISTARPQPNGIAYVDLQVQKLADATADTKDKTDAAPLLANNEGVVDANLQDARRETPFVSAAPPPQDSSTPSSRNSSADEKKNYLGGGFLFTPGQGVKLIGIYQRSQLGLLSDNDSLSVKAGGQGSALGGVNYFADYVMFGALHRRLTLQFTGSSDFTASRIFNGLKTDERRTGGLARGELEWFRDKGGNLLRTYIEGRRATVELTAGDSTVGKVNLTTLELGSLYLFDRSAVRYPSTVRLEPRARFGLGLAATEPKYARLQLTGNYHQKLPRLFELDFSGRLEMASRATPLFELPSLGGAECLRGFRVDDALGRRLWSLQNELWVPVPGTGESNGGVNQFLRRSVRLAGFIDVGGVYQTTGTTSGARAGPGAGLRLIYNPVVLKLDWAYGLGDGARGTGRGRFYFTVSTNLPF
jgi:hypothetical protein